MNGKSIFFDNIKSPWIGKASSILVAWFVVPFAWHPDLEVGVLQLNWSNASRTTHSQPIVTDLVHTDLRLRQTNDQHLCRGAQWHFRSVSIREFYRSLFLAARKSSYYIGAHAWRLTFRKIFSRPINAKGQIHEIVVLLTTYDLWLLLHKTSSDGAPKQSPNQINT